MQRLLDQSLQRNGATRVFPPDIIASDTDRKTIAALKKERDPAIVVPGIQALVTKGGHKEADYEERLWMIKTLMSASVVVRPAPGSPGTLDSVEAQRALWESFGQDLMPVAAENLDLFKASYRRGVVSGVDSVKRIQAAWERDVKATGNSHLSKNAQLVMNEMERVGIASSAAPTQKPASDAAPEEQVRLAAMQDAARKTVLAEKALRDMLEIPVGYHSEERQGYGPIRMLETFDPQNPPTTPLAGPVRGLQQTGEWWIARIDAVDPPLDAQADAAMGRRVAQPYTNVKQTYDALRAQVSLFMNDFPAVYAAKQAGRLEELAKADARQAQAIVSSTLQGVRANIDKTIPKLKDDEEFWLKLKPIHDQLVKGMVQGSQPWTDPAYAFIAKEIVKDFETAEFWKDLGLSVLAAAAFLVAELATAGGATFFLAAGVGVGITGYQTYKAWDDYFTLATAADSEMSEESQLVYPGQAQAALLGAILQTAFGFLDVGGPLKHWAKAAKAGLVPEMAMKGAAAAQVSGIEGLARRVGVGEVSHKAAAEIVERAVAEYGVEGAARRAGLQPHQLMFYAADESATARRILEHVNAPKSGGTGAASVRPKGYKGAPVVRTVRQATDDLPEGLVHYGLNAPQARQSYEHSIFHYPDRESGIWMDLDTGEHVVVQGDPTFVTARWMDDPEFAGRRWHSMEHFHPTSGSGWQLARYASPEDFDILMRPYWGNGIEPPNPISSLIRWHDPKTLKPRYTTIGYDGTLDQPFWIEFADPKTNKMRRVHLDALTYPQSGVDYRKFLDAEAASFGQTVDWSQHVGGGISRPTGAAAVRVSKGAGELLAQLRGFAKLDAKQADSLLSRAIEELGPAEALKAADMDWKTLSATLPKPSASAEKLLHWRDTVLGGEIQKLLPEGDVLRTGTKGSFENDFDWNFMGSNAVQNRARVVSYLSGRTGMTPPEMQRLLYADFFTDPRRMFLYERMPATFRDRIAKRQAEVERQLIWNSELTAAVASGNKTVQASVRARMGRLGVPEVPGGVKLMSPEDIRVAEGEIDKLHKDFDQALARKDYSRAERRASDIADRQAQINAAGGGGYVSYGGVRKFAAEREPELAILLEGEMLQPGWYTAVIDQLPHLRHAVEDLEKAVSKGDMAAAMRGIGKYGDRMTTLANAGLAKEAVGSAAFSELEAQFKILYAQAKASGSDAASLQSKIAVDLEGTVAQVKGLLDRLEASSEEVLATLQKTADIDVLFEQVQLYTHLHVKFLKAKEATYWQLTTLLKALKAGSLPESWISEDAARPE